MTKVDVTKTSAVKKRRVLRFARDERGAQLAELAVVLPIFLVLFASIAEFGRFFYEYTTLAKATRAGTRHLISSAVNSGEDQKAKNLVVYGNAAGTGAPVLKGLTAANVTITRAGGVPSLPQTITVSITNYKYQPLFDLGKMLKVSTLSLAVDVKPSVTMRYLPTQPLY